MSNNYISMQFLLRVYRTPSFDAKYYNHHHADHRIVAYIITLTSQWPRWRLKSPASRLFTQPFIQTQIKENIKAPRHWPLCGELTGTGEFPTHRTSYAENVSIWWRHHVFIRRKMGMWRGRRYRDIIRTIVRGLEWWSPIALAISDDRLSPWVARKGWQIVWYVSTLYTSWTV